MTTLESKPSLDLFPSKWTYAKVIDLSNMVLWIIGFIVNRYRITPTKLACVRYWAEDSFTARIISHHAPAPQQVQPAPARKAVRVPALAPQMRVPATRAGKPAPRRTLVDNYLFEKVTKTFGEAETLRSLESGSRRFDQITALVLTFLTKSQLLFRSHSFNLISISKVTIEIALLLVFFLYKRQVF